jgi:hypothetical protein
MKNTLFIYLTFLLFVVLTSCGKTQEDFVADFVQQSMKNPKSFELVSIEPYDTTFFSETLLSDISVAKLDVSYAKRDLYIAEVQLKDKSKRTHYSFSDKYYNAQVESYNRFLDEHQNKLDTLQKNYDNLINSGSDYILDNSWKVKAYGQNSFGATILSTYIVKVNKDGYMDLRELE